MCSADRQDEDDRKKQAEEPPQKKTKVDPQVGRRSNDDDDQNKEPGDDADPCQLTTALDNSVKELEFKPRQRQQHDLSLFFHGKRKPVINNIAKEIAKQQGIKWYINVQVRFIKHKVDQEDVISEPYFRSSCMTETNSSELQQHYDDAMEKIKAAFATFQKEGSGWVLDQVLHMNLHLTLPPSTHPSRVQATYRSQRN